MALGGVHGYKLVCFYWLGHTERAFRQSELLYFAGNFRVSAILAPWRQLWGRGMARLGVLADSGFFLTRTTRN